MQSRYIFCLTLLVTLMSSPLAAQQPPNRAKLVQPQQLDWGYLNPLRGDKSPGAADLWGDRSKDTASGMLVRFDKGFSSPPHIHNATYRGIVIEGALHNDDPSAEPLWLPPGSYWTQPAGESHITAAQGDSNLIFLEIASGPYLVKGPDKAYDAGESPLNVHADNIVWLDADTSTLLEGDGLELAYLWQHATQGYLLRLTAGFKGVLRSSAQIFDVVVIGGEVIYQTHESESAVPLVAGSYFASEGDYEHRLEAPQGAVVYIRTDGGFFARRQP